MNEVSIIINGVRYDAVSEVRSIECTECDLKYLCENEYKWGLTAMCATLGGLLGKNYFKKSDKKFEK